MKDAEKKREELQIISCQYTVDPIKEVIYPSFAHTDEEWRQWQDYEVALSKNNKERLIVKSKKLVVDEVVLGPNNTTTLTFTNCGIELSVEPLVATGLSDTGLQLHREDKLLWLGYYVVLVEPVPDVKGGQCVQGYFRIRAQKVQSFTNGARPSLRDVLSQLV
jgi:hypothetical protein